MKNMIHNDICTLYKDKYRTETNKQNKQMTEMSMSRYLYMDQWPEGHKVKGQ